MPGLEEWLKKRLKEEWRDVKKKNTVERMISPLKESDMRIWRGYLKDGEELHSFEIRFTNRYPFEPPEIEWLTPIKHPNIEPPRPEGLGRVCLPWLSDLREWTPDTSVNSIIEGLLYVLKNPNPGDPLLHPACLLESIRRIKEKLKDVGVNPEIREKAKRLLSTSESMLAQLGGRPNETVYNLVKEAALMVGFSQAK
jgi:ubiquitin-protein ligase